MLFTKTRINIITAISVVVAVIFIDQVIKFEVKTNFLLHEAREVTSWMYIYFVENSGMAFGVNITGTVALAAARIVFVAFLCCFAYKTAKRNSPRGFIVCISLIIAGAVGNIVDNAFYGLLFSESSDFHVASTVPFGEGYGGFMSGKVVDMFYFPLIDTVLPDCLPIVGGNHFVFFAPIFNFADSAITCGSIAILLFYRKQLSVALKQKGTDCQ